MRSALLTLAVLLAAVAPAHGWTTPYDSAVHAGPALVGDGLVWADGPFNGTISVKRAAGGAPPVTLFTVEREPGCDTYVEDLAASDLVATLYVRRSRCEKEGADIVADGKVVATSKQGFEPCGFSGHDADAGLVAVARYNCQEDPVMILDVVTGGWSDLGMTLPIGGNPVEVRIAGRYVAVVVENYSGPTRFEVIVWDRETGAEHYRVDADAIRGEQDYVVGSHRLELQSDGRVLYGVATGVSGFLWGWASKEEPALHSLTGSFWHTEARVGFAGDAIVVNTHPSSPGAAVYGFDGTLRNHFVTEYTTRSLDFDGTRLAWADMKGVHSEAYPFTPPPPPPPAPPAKPAPPPAKAASVPAAKIGPLKVTQRAKSLKAFSGSATDSDGDLLMVRLGLVRTAGKKCQTLQRSGRLKGSPRSGGRCVPTSFLTATGAGIWKLKLPRRLPAGRYTLWVQAVDAAGNAQSSFTEEAGNLRSFRLK